MSPEDCPLLYLPDEWRRLQELRHRITWHRDQHTPGPDWNSMNNLLTALDLGIRLIRPTEKLILQIIARARGLGVDLNFTTPAPPPCGASSMKETP